LDLKETILSNVSSIAKMPKRESIEMSVSEWIAVPDNPRQRDTEKHLHKAKHLLSPSPIHARVSMAISPTGERWKLDGHTRALAWHRNMVTPPAKLFVDVYPVRDAAVAREFYLHFDNAVAVETGADQIAGAYREHQFSPKSKLLRRGILSNALRLADGLARGQRFATKKEESTVYELIGSWREELTWLDSLNCSIQRFKGPLITAALLSCRRYSGAEATEFWRLYNDDAGEKLEGAMDPVEALSRVVLKNTVAASPVDMVGKALAAFEGHRENRSYTVGLKGLDPSRYLLRASREGYDGA
jgi:hypothetical protein